MLAQLAKGSFAQTIRAQTFEGLVELRDDDRVIPVLKEWTEYGRPQQAREAAVVALGKVAKREPKVVDHLIDLLDDPGFVVRRRAVAALEEAGDTRAIPALQRLRDRDLNAMIVRGAREAIERIGKGKGRTQEVKKLSDDLELVRSENKDLRDRLDRLEARAGL